MTELQNHGISSICVSFEILFLLEGAFAAGGSIEVVDSGDPHVRWAPTLEPDCQ